MAIHRGSIIVIVAWAVLSNLTQATDTAASQPLPFDHSLSFEHPATFDRHVLPILQKCIGCHGPERPQADLDLTDSNSAIELGVVVPHQAHASSLLTRVRSPDPDLRMPPDGSLSPIEINYLQAWIDAGAPWPTHWAYRRLKKPQLPALSTKSLIDWCQNPIDQFVAAKLAASSLAPSPRATKKTLLRRVYYDLIGMPPSADELRQFSQNTSPTAYHDAVDRLLASPHYGERWARHWMDVVHFAETHGHDQDRPREHAWPYRDYLIRRFNQDLPYAQFVQEQIAGDVLFPDDPWSLVGTGLLAAGPWDESSLRDIQESSIDRLRGQNLDRDDIVTTVMSTFASTSVHCARCHHHKFDPITQADYYGLQAVFAGIDKANRSYDTDLHVGQARRELQRELAQVTNWAEEKNSHLLDGETPAQIAAWEAEQQQQKNQWQPVKWLKFESAGGVHFTLQADNSLYVDGPRPDKDTYTLLIQTPRTKLRALRLTLLQDERLPQQGPGRQDNGNLHLNEIRVYEVDPHHPQQKWPLQITAAQADFEQTNWNIALAIDGQPETAWGIHPQVGQTHYALFQLQQTSTSDHKPQHPRLLHIELDQIHGRGHLLGRFALAVSEHQGKLANEPNHPQEIATILGITATARTHHQQLQLAAHVRTQRLQQKIAILPQPAQVYCGTNQFAADGSFRPVTQPRTVQVLQRGEITQPLGVATATSLSCVTGCPPTAFPFASPTEANRRVALAQWLSQPANGLVWRSIVNRVWHYHFGQPLVRTLNDFGHAGDLPSHPQLLDWLALWLQEQSGSLKSLHRLIATSATYQQSSAHRPAAHQLDADNRLLWRANRKRLDAESFRDSLLKISATLDLRRGGPSDRQFVQSKGVQVTPVVDYQAIDVTDQAFTRRSIYRFLFRTLPDPFMEALDCPDASLLTPQRAESITPVQALATRNDKLVIHQCQQLATQISDSHRSTADQVALAFQKILSRPPSPPEQRAVETFTQQHGLANACRLLFNTNEFMFVD